MTDNRTAADVLLRCISRGPAGDSSQPTVAWHDVARVAAGYDLVPLLYARLKSSGARARVPADVWGELRHAYFSSADRNLRIFRVLRSMLGALRKADIPVIVLKGAYLAEAVYGDVALRPMCDVDLLVPREDLPKAREILLGLGGVSESATDTEWCCRTSSHLPAVVIRGLVCELHWTIVAPTGPVSVDVAGFWDRARPTSIAGVDVLALSSEDLLLHLCLSVSCRDGFMGGLRSFADIAETIRHRRGKLDWAVAAACAQEWGGARYVCLALHLARSMLSAEVPDDVLERLAPGGPDQCVLESARELVLAGSGNARRLPSLFELAGAKSVGEKARLTCERVFLTRDDMAARYPASRGARHLGRYYARRLRDVARFYWGYNLRRRRPMFKSHGRELQTRLADWLKSGTD
jgi:hypothetical protein